MRPRRLGPRPALLRRLSTPLTPVEAHVAPWHKHLSPRGTNSVTGRDGAGGSAARASGGRTSSALVRALHADGPLSRSELGERTGLTRSGIRRLVGELVGAGLVVEERGESLGPARPSSPLVRLDPERRGRAGAGDRRRLPGHGGGRAGRPRLRPRPGRAARAGTSPPRTSSPTSPSSPPARAPRGARDALVGIGVAVVGVVRRDDGFVSTAPNLGWRDVPLGGRCAARSARRPRSRSPTRPTSVPSPSTGGARRPARTT